MVKIKFRCKDCKKKFEDPLWDYFDYKSIYTYNACPFCFSEDIKMVWR